MAEQEYESIQSAIELTSKPSNTYTSVNSTDNYSTQPSSQSQFPDSSYDNQEPQESIEIPITIEENKTEDMMYDNVDQEETPTPEDMSMDESKIQSFNAYTVCLDGEGPILTLKQVQAKTAKYISDHDNWKRKCPPKILILLVIIIGFAVYGLVSMINSNFDNQVSLMVAGVSCAVIIILSGCLIMKYCEKHEDFVEYYDRNGNGLRFNHRDKSIVTISFAVGYGWRPDKKGDDRFRRMHEGKIIEKQTSKICGFSQVTGIGREVIKRRDKPDGSHIYINYKVGTEFLTWKSEMGVGSSGKSRFGVLQSVMKEVDDSWLKKIHVKRDKIIKK